MMNGLRFRPDTNIRDLSGKVMLRLRNSLDVAPDAQNWRALASILEPPFAFKYVAKSYNLEEEFFIFLFYICIRHMAYVKKRAKANFLYC